MKRLDVRQSLCLVLFGLLLAPAIAGAGPYDEEHLATPAKLTGKWQLGSASDFSEQLGFRDIRLEGVTTIDFGPETLQVTERGKTAAPRRYFLAPPAVFSLPQDLYYAADESEKVFHRVPVTYGVGQQFTGNGLKSFEALGISLTKGDTLFSSQLTPRAASVQRQSNFLKVSDQGNQNSENEFGILDLNALADEWVTGSADDEIVVVIESDTVTVSSSAGATSLRIIALTANEKVIALMVRPDPKSESFAALSVEVSEDSAKLTVTLSPSAWAQLRGSLPSKCQEGSELTFSRSK